MQERIPVLLICGGRSPEHEISLRSARNVLEALDKQRFDPMVVGISPAGEWLFLDKIPDGTVIQEGINLVIDPTNRCLISSEGMKLKPEVVFPILHGPNGEDGAIQGLLQILDLPYVGPEVLGSAVAMDKDVAKKELAASGLNVAKGIVLRPTDSWSFSEISKKLGLPLFVKPANMGSSVGVHKVRNEAEFIRALEDAFQYDQKVIVEEMITGRELECAILGLQHDLEVTSPGEVRAEEEYSFDEKYSDSSGTQLDIPAKNLDAHILQELKETAHKAFNALNCEIMSRVDMFLTPDGKIYVNEINTIPGFTSISMYPKLWEHEGLNYSNLITQLLDLAMLRHQRSKMLKRERH